MRPDAPERRAWTVGTLSYGVAGLACLFLWLLWGDFAWSMKERAIQPMSQMLFKRYAASDLLLGLMVTSLPAALGMLIGPIVSVRSDRHRGRWGRRIPYLLIPTPIAAASMIGMGYAPEIADALRSVLGAHAPDPLASRLLVLCVLWTLFEIFTVIANAVFVGLINDVVPPPVIGRFFALFRMVSLGAGILFNSCLIGGAEEHHRAIFLGLGLLYGAGFTIMCLMVKEGDYPPPEPRAEGAWRARIIEPLRNYFRECSAHPFYLWVFLAAMLGNAALLPANIFDVPYMKSLGMNFERFGELRAIAYSISLGLALVIGWAADKFHPIRVGLVALGLYSALALWAGCFVRDAAGFSVAYISQAVLSGVFYTGTASLFPRLFPRARFAQFASAAGIMLALGFISVPPAVGWVLDLSGHSYHLTFLIGGGLAALGCASFWVLDRKFRQIGGSSHYRPPGDASAADA